jgi:hypothetical protein
MLPGVWACGHVTHPMVGKGMGEWGTSGYWWLLLNSGCMSAAKTICRCVTGISTNLGKYE